MQGTLANAQGTTIASYAPGTLAYVGQTESGQAVIGTVETNGEAGQLLNLSLLNSNGTFTADGFGFADPLDNFGQSLTTIGGNASSLESTVNQNLRLHMPVNDNASAFMRVA